MPFYYLIEAGPPNPSVVVDWCKKERKSVWTSNRGRDLTETEIAELAIRLPQRDEAYVRRTYSTPGDQLIARMTHIQAIRMSDELDVPVSIIEPGEEDWVFDLLNITPPWYVGILGIPRPLFKALRLEPPLKTVLYRL